MTKYLDYVWISLLSFIMPIVAIANTILLLVVVDMLFAVYTAHKLNQPITSRKLSQTIPKVILYNLFILCMYYFDKNLLESGLHLEKVAGTFISIVEIKSIDENFVKVFGYSLWGKLKNVISRGENKNKKA